HTGRRTGTSADRTSRRTRADRTGPPTPLQRGRSGGPLHGDVPHGTTGLHLDDVLAGPGPAGRLQITAHRAEAGVEIEPGGDALADADLDLPHGGLGHHGTPRHPPEAHVAVGGPGHHRGVGPIDDDPAIRRADPEVAGDRADPRFAVGVLDHRRALHRADLHGAGTGGDLGVPGGPAHRDVTGPGPEPDGTGLVDRDVADAHLVAAFAEPAAGGQRRHPRLAPHL